MTLDFLPEASVEFFEAAEYYESKQEGLGWKFRSEVLEICRLIVQHPLLWRELAGGYRRGKLSGLPLQHRLFHPGRSHYNCGRGSRSSPAGVLEGQTATRVTPAGITGIGSDPTKPLNSRGKRSISGQYFGLNGPFRGQKEGDKAVEDPGTAAVYHPR